MQIRFIFPTPRMRATTCKAHFSKNFAGKEVRQVRKAAGALRLLQAGSTIEVYSLVHEGNLAVVEVNPFSFNLPAESITWLDTLVSISETFKTTLRLPHSKQAIQ